MLRLSPHPPRTSHPAAGGGNVGVMPARPRPLPVSLDRVFTSQQAYAAGVTQGRLRARDLEAPFRGVRVIPEPAQTHTDTSPGARDRADRARVLERVAAYSPVMAPGAFLAGRTALVWHGVALHHGAELEIGVLEPDRAPRALGVRGRKIAPHLVQVRVGFGVRVASPASAWAMLAADLDVRELVRIGDHIVRVPRDERGRPHPELQLASPDQLGGAIDAGRRPGIGRLREALTLIRVGSMSPLETDARLELVRAGIPEPELDAEIRDAEGRLLGIAAGAYRAHRVLLEIEGDHHRTDAAQWARDLTKHAAYAAAGWSVVRLARPHIRGPRPDAAAMVRAALRRAGAEV